jgi:hypothetical protein
MTPTNIKTGFSSPSGAYFKHRWATLSAFEVAFTAILGCAFVDLKLIA